jgi:hypothetical protein
MNQFRTFAAAVAAAGLLAAMPAAAVVKIATYSGTISRGNDDTGVFTAPGTNLAGYSWVIKYTYDKALGGVQSGDGLTYDLSYGGPAYGVVGSPIIKATFTINGVTLTEDGSYGGIANTNSSPFTQHFAYETPNNGTTTGTYYLYSYSNVAGAAGSLDQNVGPLTTNTGGGGFIWSVQDIATGNVIDNASGDFGTDMVYSVGNAVPEPASWALMIGGFGMVGAALRRHRTVATA